MARVFIAYRLQQRNLIASLCIVTYYIRVEEIELPPLLLIRHERSTSKVERYQLITRLQTMSRPLPPLSTFRIVTFRKYWRYKQRSIEPIWALRCGLCHYNSYIPERRWSRYIRLERARATTERLTIPGHRTSTFTAARTRHLLFPGGKRWWYPVGTTTVLTA